MNLAQMRLEVRRALDELTADFWTDNEINDWLNEGVRTMCQIAQPLQYIHQFTTQLRPGSTTEYAQEYALPEDIDEVYGVSLLSSGALYELMLGDSRRIQLGTKISGTPDQYYIRYLAKQKADHVSTGGLSLSDVIRDDSTAVRPILGLFPVPNSALTVNVCYYSKHFIMTANNDVCAIPYEFQRGPICFAIAKGKEKDAAFAEADRYMDQFQQYASNLRDKMIHRGQQVAFPRVRDCDGDAQALGYMKVYYGED